MTLGMTSTDKNGICQKVMNGIFGNDMKNAPYITITLKAEMTESLSPENPFTQYTRISSNLRIRS